MKIEEIKGIARQHNLKVGKAKKSELVRAIQESQGNQPCFDSNRSADCCQYSCCWREDCV